MNKYQVENTNVDVTTSGDGKKARSQCYIATLIAVAASVAAIAFIVVFVIYYKEYEKCNNAMMSTTVSTVSPTTPSTQWKNNFDASNPMVSYTTNAVASDNPVCSMVVSYILNVLGGNAMDAAVSGMFCLGVNNFQSQGIGGGGFMVFYKKSENKAMAFNFRETATINAHKDMYQGPPGNQSLYGGLAIGIPGEVLGLHTAHKAHGKLQWSQLIQPAIDILKKGTQVGLGMEQGMNSSFTSIPESPPFNILKQWLTKSGSTGPVMSGDIIKNDKLMATLQTIQNNPFDFYNGSLAADIVEEINSAGGNFTLDDLKNYKVSTPTPVSVPITGKKLTMHGLPPPSSSVLIGFILNVLDSFGMNSQVKNDFDNYVNYLHRVIESDKYAFAKRSEFGDNNFVNNSALLQKLMSKEYATEIKNLITDDKTHNIGHYEPSFNFSSDAGTTQLCVVDGEGNAVSITSTINTYFGSMVMGNKTGIIYNNEMDDFSVPGAPNFYGIPPAEANFIVPGKRPLSSMSPIIMTDDMNNVKFVAGAAGGTKIITTVAYVLSRVLILDESLKEAMDSYRMHHQLVPNTIQYSPHYSNIPTEIKNALQKKGHTFTLSGFFKSVMEAIMRLPGGELNAYTDFRKPSLSGGV